MKEKIILLTFMSLISLSCNSKRKLDLINNYKSRTSEILEAKKEINSIVPSNYDIWIRFSSSKEIDLRVWERKSNSTKFELLFRQWGFDPFAYVKKPQSDYDKKYGGKTNSLKLVKKKLKWTDETFKKIKKALDKADCIGISDGNPTKIEYGYNGLGIYSYLIFDNNLDNNEIEKYNDGCNNIFYKENIVLAYDGGAIGMQCFEDYYNQKENEKHNNNK